MGALFRSIIGLSLCVALIAIVVSRYEDNRELDFNTRPDYLGPIQDRPPKHTREFGRFVKPLETIDYGWVSSSKLFNFFALKHWDFKSISTGRYFIVAAIANFNYVANAFVYVIDRANANGEIYQYAAQSGLALAINEQANSSIDGCTQFYRSNSESIRLCYEKEQKRYRMNVNVPVQNGIQVSFDCYLKYTQQKDQSLALLYPVNPDRPVYTHKMAGLPAEGKIRIGPNPESAFDDGFGSVDWTLGYPARICRWKWASLSTSATDSSNQKKVSIGINLSDWVYNDKNGVSMEAAVWIDGKVYTLDRTVYQIPEQEYQTTQSWKIYSAETTKSPSPKIDLVFTPQGSQEEHINVLLLAGDFVQVFGLYNGTIEYAGHTYTIENAFGVTENHYAKW